MFYICKLLGMPRRRRRPPKRTGHLSPLGPRGRDAEARMVVSRNSAASRCFRWQRLSITQLGCLLLRLVRLLAAIGGSPRRLLYRAVSAYAETALVFS